MCFIKDLPNLLRFSICVSFFIIGELYFTVLHVAAILVQLSIEDHFLFYLLPLMCTYVYPQVTKDATQGSEAGKAISLYVLDAFISIDQEKFFLNQLQSRGILRSCLTDISNVPYKVSILLLDILNSNSFVLVPFLLYLSLVHKL